VAESGRYIVPDAFRPIAVDRERNRVQYSEENVWMLHPGQAGRSGHYGRAPRCTTTDLGKGRPR